MAKCPSKYDPRAAGSGLRESEEKSHTRKSTHDSRDESVAADAVEAERLSGRDCVQLPLQQALRAMKACLHRGVGDAQMSGRLVRCSGRRLHAA